MKRHYAVVLCSLLACLAIAAVAVASKGDGATGLGRCFPAASWNAKQGERPCVRVLRVEEDGSFSF